MHRIAASHLSNVRFGSKADIEARPADVRFTPESRHPIQTLKYPIQLSGFFSPFQNLNSLDDTKS
jgi:hypothetical protein